MNERRLAHVVVGVIAVAWGASQIKTGMGGSAGAQDSVFAGPASLQAAIPAAGAAGELKAQANEGWLEPQQGVRALTSANSVRLVPKRSGQCQALAPADWQVMGVSPRGDVGELASGDGRSYSGWGIRGVNRIMEPYYGALYGDPMTSSRFLLGKAAEALGDRSGFAPVGSPARFGDGYVVQELRSSVNRAVIVFKLYPAGGFSPDSYIISLRMAIAPLGAGDFALKTAAGVAGSINCQTMFVPPVNNDVPLPRPGDVHDRRRQREAKDLADYNVQLGTQTFHSPTTGETILVDRAKALTNGPDGEGVYRRVGNSYEKLTPGRAP